MFVSCDPDNQMRFFSLILLNFNQVNGINNRGFPRSVLHLMSGSEVGKHGSCQTIGIGIQEENGCSCEVSTQILRSELTLFSAILLDSCSGVSELVPLGERGKRG